MNISGNRIAAAVFRLESAGASHLSVAKQMLSLIELEMYNLLELLDQISKRSIPLLSLVPLLSWFPPKIQIRGPIRIAAENRVSHMGKRERPI